jgi:hypothetical protein
LRPTLRRYRATGKAASASGAGHALHDDAVRSFAKKVCRADRAKFDICAAQAIDKTASEKIYAMLSTLGDQTSFNEFWPLLHKA